MSTTATTAMGRNSTRFPFTATQWQELEQQAIIYKYIAAGVPIPPDLLFTIKRSLDSSLSSKFFPTYHPTSPLGWNAYNQIQMGYGKKIDPEPGRCRRTDGKKWRCSKEAFPDSKYCERHMHRGKNRSRKPVEITNPNFTTNKNPSTTTLASNNGVTIASSSPATNSICSTNSASLTHQSLMTTTPSKTHSTSSLYSLPSLPSIDSPYNSLYSHPYYSHKDYTSRERYFHGLKEGVGEHAFFTENSSSSMRALEESWQLGGYNYNPNHQMKQQEKQCYIWGKDFNTDLSMRRVEEERENDNDKTTHHFLDEWPLKATGGGGGVGGGDTDSSSWHDSPSTTQLSISIPTSTASHQHHHDFFLSNSRTHQNDG